MESHWDLVIVFSPFFHGFLFMFINLFHFSEFSKGFVEVVRRFSC